MHNVSNSVDGNGKTGSLHMRSNGGVNTNDLSALNIDQWSTYGSVKAKEKNKIRNKLDFLNIDATKALIETRNNDRILGTYQNFQD